MSASFSSPPLFHSFEDVLNHLEHLGLFHMDMGLGRMHRALTVLRLDQNPPLTVQIVGTNGKGSTATFLASLARAHGLKTGLHTSPHFVTPRERVQVNGAMLDADLWTSLANKVMAAAKDLTYFEFLTVLSLLAFAETKVDLIVMEAGLGGHYDATTAAPAHLVCFTPISLDHEKVLGPTIAHIASDKAEAMRPGSLAITGPQSDEAMACLTRVASDKGVVLHQGDLLAPPLPPDLPLGLHGPHQRVNARLALAAWSLVQDLLAARPAAKLPASAPGVFFPARNRAVAAGLAAANIAGRFQQIPADKNGTGLPPLLLDGAHNPHGLTALVEALADGHIAPGAVIFSCLADKNVSAMVPLVRRLAQEAPLFIPTIQDNERAMAGEQLAALLGPSAIAEPRLYLALEAARRLSPAPTPEHPVLVCGSLYLLGELFTLKPRLLFE